MSVAVDWHIVTNRMFTYDSDRRSRRHRGVQRCRYSCLCRSTSVYAGNLRQAAGPCQVNSYWRVSNEGSVLIADVFIIVMLFAVCIRE